MWPPREAGVDRLMLWRGGGEKTGSVPVCIWHILSVCSKQSLFIVLEAGYIELDTTKVHNV